MNHEPFDGYGGPWQEIRNGRADATGYKAHVLECVTALRDAGTSYNSEVGPAAAVMMAERFGYPALELDHRAEWGCVSRDFGSHCYMAGQAYRARLEREANKAAADTLRAGHVYKRLRSVQGGWTVTSARLVRFTHTGSECELQAKRGASVVSFKCTAVDLLHMVESANERAAMLAARRGR
jgi:hypothetical protein